MRHRARLFLAASAILAFGLSTLPASAEVFLVTDIVDAIPAPEGSLRWAIEQSEGNGERDGFRVSRDSPRLDQRLGPYVAKYTDNTAWIQ